VTKIKGWLVCDDCGNRVKGLHSVLSDSLKIREVCYDCKGNYWECQDCGIHVEQTGAIQVGNWKYDVVCYRCYVSRNEGSWPEDIVPETYMTAEELKEYANS